MNPTPVSAVTRSLGFLRATTLRGPADTVVHAPDDADREPHLLLVVHSAGRARLTHVGTALADAGTGLAHAKAAEVCRPGDVFVRDPAEPFALHELDDHEVHFVRIPRRFLGLTDPQASLLVRRAPVAGSAVAALLGPALTEPGRTPSARTPRTAPGLATGVAELVALLAVECEPGGPESATPGGACLAGARDPDPDPASGPQSPSAEREHLVRRLRAYVDAHLWDRQLTPARVAAAQHISIRYLHKLFEGQGSTIGRWIQHRRLEEARRELARPGRGDLTVSAVARRWGFTSATHFSRSFRARYGVSPSDWRDGRVTPTGEAHQDVA